MLRGALPASCFITVAPPSLRPFRNSVPPQRRPRVLRFARRRVRASAEEELFIRHHSIPVAQKPFANTARPKDNETEEHFDFVREDDENGTRIATAQPTSPSKNEAANTTPEAGDERVGVAAPPGLRGLSVRAKREAQKLVTNSEFVNKWRMPTSQETVLFAWELTLVLALLMLLRAGVSSTLRWIHNRLNTTRGLKSNIPYEASVFECMQRPLEFLSLFTVGTALAEVVSRPLAATGLLRHIRTMRELGIIISATWFLLRWIERIRSRFSVAKSVDKSQVDATSRIATVATFVASVLISLDTIGINVQTVLAFGGIGGVAIGFAGREIISNFFGGFMIYVTRPFSVGEWIRCIEQDELNGTVEDIGWYLTRVRTWDKRPLYIPNSRFSTLIVENGSRMDNRRILHTLHVRHEDMPAVPNIVATMENLLMSHQELDPRQHRLVYIDSFGEYSVKIWLSCYTKSVFLYDYRRVQQDILLRCYEIVRNHGAKLATINTRDVRSGIDTDKYGPLGNAATFGPGTQRTQRREYEAASDETYEDVPVKQPNVNSNPMTGYTIESGVDLSAQQQRREPNGVPSNSSVTSNRHSDRSKLDDRDKASSGKRSGSHLSTSEAAVAAAAAALAAARRNASRVEGSEKPKSQTASRTRNDKGGGISPNAETGNVSAQPPGEMRISAGKPTRSSSTSTGASGGGTHGSAVTKQGEKTSNETSAPMTTAQMHGGGEESRGGVGIKGGSKQNMTGEMKISKARKPVSVDPTMTDDDRRGESASSKSGSRDGDVRISSGDGKGMGKDGAPGAGGQERKLGVNKGTRAPSSAGNGNGTGSGGLKTGDESGQHAARGTNNNATGHHKGSTGRDGGNGTTKGAVTGRQGTGAGSGEMKISKARKPKSINPMDTGSENSGSPGAGIRAEDDGEGGKGGSGDVDGVK